MRFDMRQKCGWERVKMRSDAPENAQRVPISNQNVHCVAQVLEAWVTLP